MGDWRGGEKEFQTSCDDRSVPACSELWPAGFDPEQTSAVLISPPRSGRSDPHTGTPWRPRNGGHSFAAGTDGDGDAAQGLRTCGLTPRKPRMQRAPPPGTDHAVPPGSAASRDYPPPGRRRCRRRQRGALEPTLERSQTDVEFHSHRFKGAVASLCCFAAGLVSEL
jgi:hypothetical protein